MSAPPGTFSGHGLAARRGERLLFAGLDFALPPGAALVLSGPNGSGKSTLLRLMAGFGRPERGRLAWEGAAVAADPEAHRARLHYVGHQDALKPALSAAETLRFWASLAGHPAGGGAAALEPFGIGRLADLPCRFLSSGQRRRLALSRLVAWSAPLWLLDEPTVGLDAEAVGRLAAAISAHRAEGGSVVLATHQALPLDEWLPLSLADFPPLGLPAAAIGW